MHSYSILEAKNIKGIDTLVIRNPWGWIDDAELRLNSRIERQNKINEKRINSLKFPRIDEEYGNVYMSFSTFLRNFI